MVVRIFLQSKAVVGQDLNKNIDRLLILINFVTVFPNTGSLRSWKTLFRVNLAHDKRILLGWNEPRWRAKWQLKRRSKEVFTNNFHSMWPCVRAETWDANLKQTGWTNDFIGMLTSLWRNLEWDSESEPDPKGVWKAYWRWAARIIHLPCNT